MPTYIEEMLPITGHHYKKISSNKKVAKSILTMYPGLFDSHLAHGWLGDIYGVWTLAIALLYASMFSGGVQLGYLAILIPVSIEVCVVVIGNAWLAYLTMRADKSQRAIVRHRVDIMNRTLKSATIAKANADNDQTFFLAGLSWNIFTVFLMIVFATSITVSPNYVAGAPAPVLNYSLGLIENFRNPIRPDDNGNINVVFAFVLLLLVKSACLLNVFCSRTAPVALRGKLHKIDESIDQQGEKGQYMGMTAEELVNAPSNKHGERSTAAQQPVMIGV
jgi:hypothetical protein